MLPPDVADVAVVLPIGRVLSVAKLPGLLMVYVILSIVFNGICKIVPLLWWMFMMVCASRADAHIQTNSEKSFSDFIMRN
jgi:hypothetical protein